jgi:hypothetical protein
VVLCDARNMTSVKEVLITLVEHVLSGRATASPPPAGAVISPGG